MMSLDFSIDLSKRIMALRSTQALAEMGTRNTPVGKGIPVLKADSLAAICQSII
jgi:hypothetical protein